VLPNDVPFRLGQSARLDQDLTRNAHLPQVVQQTRNPECPHRGAAQLEVFSQRPVDGVPFFVEGIREGGDRQLRFLRGRPILTQRDLAELDGGVPHLPQLTAAPAPDS
jgi:hypothetical protein